MISGFHIQKEVIAEYYQDSLQKRMTGISVMLLNTYQTCLHNLFHSKLDESEMKQKISTHLSNESLIECTYNESSARHFSVDYITAIKNNNIDYLYGLGQSMYKRSKPKQYLLQLISRIA
jgi:hypothetical protein